MKEKMSNPVASSAIYARIRGNPKFGELVARRSRFSTVLSIIVLVVFYGFVLAVAFDPVLIGTRLGEGSPLTVGVGAGLFMFVFFWVLTALYVRRANTEFDALTEEIVRDAAQQGAAR